MKTLLFIAAGLMAGSVFAGPTGLLTISGTVVAIDNIAINPTTDSTALDIINGENAALGKRVANPVETSNRIAGYTILMTSANVGDLVHKSLPASKTSYTIQYNDSAFVSLSTPKVFPGQGALTGLTVKTSVVNVKVAALATAVEGTYEDVITISMVAN